MQTGKTNDETRSGKGALLGEFAQFAVHAKDMTEEQRRRVAARFEENNPVGDAQEMLKHRDLQMRTVGEQIRFAHKNNRAPS